MGKKRPKRNLKKLSVDVVEAQHINLVDEFGIVRAELWCGGGDGGVGGHTLIRLNGDDGHPRIELQVTEKGANIAILNVNQSTGIGLAVNDEMNSGIGINDGQGGPAIGFGIAGPKSNDPRGPLPHIDFYDPLTKRGLSLDFKELLSECSKRAGLRDE